MSVHQRRYSAVVALTDMDISLLRQRAEKVCRHAFAPYSDFSVGAAIQTTDGAVHVGCNVEASNYALSTCAERSAIVSAVGADGPGMRIAHVVIVTGRGVVAAPCGSCRQLLYEWGPDCLVTLAGRDDAVTHAMRDLLPFPFGPEDLAHAPV